mmetsp:Transcript_33598/g.55503  ORF Transcript_33598/g.55503 Transcript_33598/m.55503 type:complete len:92 (-) Transcript_33598:350-625(-)
MHESNLAFSASDRAVHIISQLHDNRRNESQRVHGNDYFSVWVTLLENGSFLDGLGLCYANAGATVFEIGLRFMFQCRVERHQFVDHTVIEI